LSAHKKASLASSSFLLNNKEVKLKRNRIICCEQQQRKAGEELYRQTDMAPINKLMDEFIGHM
jgi:hypothetical protein